MSLPSGTRLGPYDVVALLGAGGMGEVYRARDRKLGRDVAIKVIAPALLSDSMLAARFDREAHVLASLTHPNIAAVYGFEEDDGRAILVLELVEGATLEESLADGRKLLAEVLAIGRQIAEALEFAHEHGVIHRDLKPANIKLTEEGVVKVLDFGLAKVMDRGGSSNPELTHSPTISLAATSQGVVLGTAAYMSPEQAKGKTVDRRADIWAFGVVLYEMLAGSRLFEGETVSDTLAAVLRQDIDWSLLAGDTPPVLRRLLRRCLERDPRQRLRDIGEARVAIAEATNPSLFGEPVPEPAAPAPDRPKWRRAGVAALALLAAAVLGWLAPRRGEKLEAPVLRFSVPAPAGQAIELGWHENVSFSGDGRRIAFVAGNRIYVRELSSGQSRPIPGTEEATDPFFSPDGEWLGFIASGKIRKTKLSGAGLMEVADVIEARGATWLDDGSIVFAADAAQGLSRVPSGGGKVQSLTRLDSGRQERTHRWPEALPGGKAVLFVSQTRDNPEFYDNATVEAVEVASGRVHRVLEGASMARYVASRRSIVFARGGELFVQRFDPDRWSASGESVSVLTGVLGEPTTGASYFSVSRDASLAYVAGNPRSAERRFFRISRDGKIEPLALPVRRFLDFALSPDGGRIAMTVAQAIDSVWIYDLKLGTFGKMSSTGNDFNPIWISNDEVLFSRAEAGAREKFHLVRAAANQGDSGKIVATSDSTWSPDGMTPDGRWALCDFHGPTGRSSVVEVALDGSTTVREIASSGELASLSPDGRWIAYQSALTGGMEIYVRAAPPATGQWQVSAEGGTEPRWSRDGRDLYFRCGARLCAASVKTSPTFSSERPRRIVDAEIFPPWGTYVVSYAVGLDGTVYGLLPQRELAATPAVDVVWNWGKELQKALDSR